MTKKIECGVYVFLTLIWFLGCQGIIVLLLKVFLKVDTTAYLEFHKHHMYKINFIIQILCILGIWGAEWLFKKQSLTEYTSFNKKRISVYIGYGIILWFFTGMINNILGTFFTDYNAQIEELFENTEYVLRFLVIVIFAPLVEEYTFRGKIQGFLKVGFGKIAAVVLQGILFGMMHPLALQKIYATFLGISFGVIKEKEGNLQSTTIIHMTINLIGFVIGTLLIQ